jgi:2'-5' RNA ligase
VTREEQTQFAVGLIYEVRNRIVAKLNDVPEEWDGHELRQWVADHFALASFTLKKMRQRYRRYKNACRVRNLV